ncbi:MAG: hypothetical protein ACUVV3_08825 [Dehalococcoidia bacterium]
MATKKPTILVRLDDAAKLRVKHAARIVKQSAGAFLEEAGEERARQVLLDWALERHRRSEASFSELAADTGLTVEEIMLALGDRGRQEALEAFLASCRTVAEVSGNRDFLRLGEAAVKTVRRAREPGEQRDAEQGTVK